MNNSDNIFAINTDPNASIFKVANYAVIGDIYEVIPKLIEQVKQGKGVKA
jgi:electron transfer flavoprotein alpha subunit